MYGGNKYRDCVKIRRQERLFDGAFRWRFSKLTFSGRDAHFPILLSSDCKKPRCRYLNPPHQLRLIPMQPLQSPLPSPNRHITVNDTADQRTNPVRHLSGMLLRMAGVVFSLAGCFAAGMLPRGHWLARWRLRLPGRLPLL